MGLAKFAPRGMESAVIGRSLMLAAVLHGVYDFLLMSNLMNFYLTVLVVVVLHSVLLSRIRFALSLSPFSRTNNAGVEIEPEKADDE
jgi:RsiW-degrading membrane proteinase PrsW (M82 family)